MEIVISNHFPSFKKLFVQSSQLKPPFKDSSIFSGAHLPGVSIFGKKHPPMKTARNSAGEAACDVGHEAGELKVFVLDIWPQDLGPKLVDPNKPEVKTEQPVRSVGGVCFLVV